MMQKRVLTSVWAIGAVIALASCAIEPGSSASTQPSMAGGGFHTADTAAGNYMAGRFALDAHDLPAAAAFLRAAASEDPDQIEVLQRAHLALAANGQLDEATDIAERLLRFDSDASTAAVLVVEQQAKRGKWPMAEERVQSLPKRGLNMLLIPLVVAWSEMGQGHTDKALAALETLNADGHQTALYEFHAALICDLAGRNPEAERHYRAALAADGGDALRTVEAASAFFRRTGAPDAAKEIVDHFRQDHPDLLLVDFNATARPIDSPRAGLAEAFFALASTLRQTGAEDLALIFLRLTLDLEPHFALAQVMTGDTLHDLGRLNAAIEVYNDIDSKNPAHWVAQLRIAGDYNALDRLDDAIHTLEQASAARPDRPEALITEGDLLRRHERWTDSIAAYDRALAVIGTPRREDWAVLYARGVAESSANQWPRAEADFNQALQLEPDQPDVLNYLGYSWVEKGTNVDQASHMIEKALSKRPTDGFIVDSLGWVYFRTGKYDKAVTQLERAVELAPDDATINSHLGDALAAVGRVDEARFQWNRALVFKPDDQLKAELNKKLHEGFTPPTPIKVDSKDSAAQ
jgi:tetratricopeptide (TPR) repeat protein